MTTTIVRPGHRAEFTVVSTTDSSTTYRRAQNGKTSTYTLPMTVSEFAIAHSDWIPGELIQEAFPDLSNDDREWIMTGLTPEEWDKMFPLEDND